MHIYDRATKKTLSDTHAYNCKTNLLFAGIYQMLSQPKGFLN